MFFFGVEGKEKTAGGPRLALHSAVSELFNHGMVYTSQPFELPASSYSSSEQCVLFSNANRSI